MARRYSNTPFIQNPETKKRQYETTLYPQVTPRSSDIYLVTVRGDRLDNLAYEYYGDATLWWIISIANSTLNQGSMYMPVGTQLRIPQNITSIISEYNKINEF